MGKLLRQLPLIMSNILSFLIMGKYFFGYGDKAGAVTSKYPAEPLDHPVVSEVISEESGEQFLLLHNAGDNPQFTTVATL